MRITAPTYTQIPNDLFDQWLPLLGEVELKVLLAIMRKTFGWHRIRDCIALSQLQKMTGSTATNIVKAIKSLIEMGLIKKEIQGPKGNQTTYYELIVHENSNNSNHSQGERGTPPDSGVVTPPDSGVTKEKQKKLENVVVVKGDPPPSFSKSDKSITKDDIHAMSIRTKKDWQPYEIDSAWKIYKAATYPISDIFAYIEGIINKTRITSIQKEKNKCNQPHKGKSQSPSMNCKQQPMKDQSSSKMPLEITNENISANGMSEPILAQFSFKNLSKERLDYLCKARGIF